MSWVLILVPPITGAWPAIIGGYSKREDAEAAGELATQFSENLRISPPFTRYVVVAGAACDGPLGSTYSSSWREINYTNDGPKAEIHRETQRF